MKFFTMASLVLLAQFAPPVAAAGPADGLDRLADLALAENPALAESSITALRAAGPAGLDAMLRRQADEITGLRDALAEHAAVTPRQQRLRAALDRVARQRDAFSAGLYWHTDFTQARKAAAAAGRPILSLRLLGNLDEELSCANSRFFRTVLYADAGVSALLHDHFILHWQSVRPAPRLIVNYGDGRSLERTITGNSLHYILTPDGAPVDALPGLIGPAAFLRLLKSAETAALQIAPLKGGARAEALRRFHAERLAAFDAVWPVVALRAGMTKLPPFGALPAAEKNGRPPSPPDAITAGRITVGKGSVEISAIRSIIPMPPPSPSSREAAEWDRIADLYAADARLDAGSLRMMRIKSAAPPPVREFERAIAVDTVRNEYLLHREIDRWFVAGLIPSALDALTKKIYAELFLTPDSDPWLGLAPADAYAAIENDGITITAVAR